MIWKEDRYWTILYVYLLTDPLVQLTIDESRNILYSRSEKGVIQVCVCVCIQMCVYIHVCVCICVCMCVCVFCTTFSTLSVIYVCVHFM